MKKLLFVIWCFIALACVNRIYSQTTQQKKDPPKAEDSKENKQVNSTEYILDAEKVKNCSNPKIVAIRAIFRANGKVTDIEVDKNSLSGLPEGKTKGLVKKIKDAASHIRFTPAMKDGRPVSQYVRIEYNFCMDDINKSKSDKEKAKPNNSSSEVYGSS
jgi:hypothetical protein